MKSFIIAVNWFFLLVGLLILGSAAKYIMDGNREMEYQSSMENKYDFYRHDNLAEVTQKQQFHGVTIHTYYENENGKAEVDFFDRKVKRADIFVEMNGEVVTTIEGTDVYFNEAEMGVFEGTVEYILIEERETGEETLAIAIETARQNPRIVEDHMRGLTSDEQSSYRVFLINEEGTITEEKFTLETKNELQTQLIRNLTLTWHGYHNDLPYVMSTLLQLQLMLGGILVLVFGLILIILHFRVKKIL